MSEEEQPPDPNKVSEAPKVSAEQSARVMPTKASEIEVRGMHDLIVRVESDFLTLSAVGSGLAFKALILMAVGLVILLSLIISELANSPWVTEPGAYIPDPEASSVILQFVVVISVVVCTLFVVSPLLALLKRKRERARQVEGEIERLQKQATVSAKDVTHIFHMIQPGTSMARPQKRRSVEVVGPKKSRSRM